MKPAASFWSPRAVLEPLESRRMLSSSPILEFAGRFPSVLSPSLPTAVELRVVNTTGHETGAGQQLQVFANGDVLLGSASLTQPIRPDGNRLVRVLLEPPTALPDGHFSLTAQLTGSTGTAVSPKPMAFENPFSDLALEFSKLPQRPVQLQGPGAGRAVATVTLMNAGNIPARGQVSLKYYLSADDVLDATDPLLGSVASWQVALKPGGHQSVSFHIAVPPGTVAGGYFLFAVLTPGTSLDDSAATDNTAISARRVAVVSSAAEPTKIIKQINVSSSNTTIIQTTVVCVGGSGCGDESSNTGDNGSADSAGDQPGDTGNNSGDQAGGEGSGDSSNTAGSDSPQTPADSSGDPTGSSDDWDPDAIDSSGGDF
jgi:hypothetical protein